MAVYGSSLPNYAGRFAQSVSFAPTIGQAAKPSQRKPITPGMSPEAQAEAAWQEAMKLLQRQGPYTPEVVNQLTNRRADQSAAAEAVNAEEIRNTAAARGMDPTQALRQAQQQRQAQNVAFTGDIASQAAVQNFAAETPGRMAAAQANLQRQFGGATAPAVYGGGVSAPAPQRTAFASQSFTPQPTPAPAPTPKPVIAPTPQKQPMSVADRNAAQAAWAASGGKTINGTTPKPAVGPTAAANAPIYRTPAQQTSLQNSLNRGIQYTPGVATKIPLAFSPDQNPFK